MISESTLTVPRGENGFNFEVEFFNSSVVVLVRNTTGFLDELLPM